MTGNQFPPTGPKIENPKKLLLPAAAEAILKCMFPTHRRVVVKAELGSGFSTSRVFLVHPITDTPELPAVVKIAPAQLVEKEYRAYQAYICDRLSGAAEIKREPVLTPASRSDPTREWGGLRYHLVGSGIFEIESLSAFCRHASLKDIWHVLEKRLFKRMGPLWRFSDSRPQFNFGASYDYLLPVNLLIEPTRRPPGAPLHLLASPRDGGTFAPSTNRPIRAGDYVRLEGFVITEVDPAQKAVTLNLPVSPVQGEPQPAVAVSYRLRLQPVEEPSLYRVNDSIDAIEGLVRATRYDLLQAQVQRAFGQAASDVGAGLPTVPPSLVLPGKTDLALPDPLAALSDILAGSRHVRVAYIHGDLNLENILVDPDARDVRLIDFAMSRRDHVLHDLLRLETGIVTWLLPEILAEARLPPETIYDLYSQLHCAAHRAPAHFSVPQQLQLALRKPFVMLAAVRKMARECLFEAGDWGEYYQGLTLYLLGALKFENLDENPTTPLPKQIAFWGAAAAQKLLREPPPCEETGWQPLSAVVDDLAGQTLDQYEIGELIGEGSIATVYRARQPRLQRDVAVKVMRPTLASHPELRQRFEREAQAIASLRHPNILTVYDYGETADGRLYLVVDCVEGGTLRERMEQRGDSPRPAGGIMPLEETVELVAQVAEALDYAHRHGIVHRDVKPNNILLTADGRPLLADFGLVKSFQGERHLTDEGVMLGTPDYMAPEQAQGMGIDNRADIYALGVTLFEMLTGQHPYEGETSFSVIVKHVSEPMPRPGQVNPAVPPALDEIVARATAKSLDERYQWAGDMARDLRAALAAVQPGAVAGADLRPRPPAELPPFIAGPPITHPRQFFGRERELKRLFNLWKSAPLQNAAIIGPRRSGKTSLLLYLKSITTRPPSQLRPGQRTDWLPEPERYSWIFVDFQDPRLGTRQGLLGYLLASLGLSIPGPCDLERFIEVVSGGLQNPTVILLDEIGVALERYPELDNAFWEGMRSLATNYVRGNLGFVLAAHEPPDQLARHSQLGSPFFNIFGYAARLGPLTEGEARELIASSPVSFPAAGVEWILAQSGRWPLLLQILCRERMIALECGETDNAWREEGLRQMEPFRRLLEV